MDEKQFMRVAKALADPQRFEMYATISGSKEISCGAIAELFPIQQSTVSHHLKVLVDADIVSARREGQHSYFTSRPKVLESYIKELQHRVMPSHSKHSTRRISGKQVR